MRLPLDKKDPKKAELLHAKPGMRTELAMEAVDHFGGISGFSVFGRVAILSFADMVCMGTPLALGLALRSFRASTSCFR